MTLEEKLQFCKMCENRKFSAAVGVVCGLTDEKPAFESKCPDFKIDQKEADRLVQREKALQVSEAPSGSFAPEQAGIRKGVLGGVLMIVIAVVWFVVGWMAGYIYFYPPILFLVGVYALIKGIATGNLAGEKNKTTGV